PQSTRSIFLLRTLLKLINFRKFVGFLSEHTKPGYKSIPHGKLEDKDRLDTAKLLTAHYGSQDALLVTVDILEEINQNDLAQRLQRSMGKFSS
uniref:Pyrin domain-containing protein n=1 Tax=Fundulus heteroclitus TaxID=8078 RepID=A0A3Q2TGX8_FUNHE